MLFADLSRIFNNVINLLQEIKEDQLILRCDFISNSLGTRSLTEKYTISFYKHYFYNTTLKLAKCQGYHHSNCHAYQPWAFKGGGWVEERFFWTAKIMESWTYLCFFFNLPINCNNTALFSFLMPTCRLDRIQQIVYVLFCMQ